MAKFKKGDKLLPNDKRPEVCHIEITGISIPFYLYTVYYTDGQTPRVNTFEIKVIDRGWRKLTKLETILR